MRLRALLEPFERASSPLGSPLPLGRAAQSKIHWVEPRLVAQVSFRERTRDGRLRHPVYLGLRDDREAATVTDPQPSDDPTTQTLRRGKRELRLSHLDKLFWAERGITKGDLIAYYRDVSPVLVPHLAHRPFTMRRYPDGAAGKAFFQKDAPKHMPDWIPTYHALVTTRDRERTKRWIDFPIVNDELALLWMVNMGCIDMNAWYSRVDKPDRPDFVLFDLDPMPDVPWTQTIEVALILHRLLDQLALRSFPKTSGGKGLHVLVPVHRRTTYEDTRSFASLIATTIAQAHPGLATTAWSKAKRRGVLIDANQNGSGKTIASVYSVRPRPDATVSTPLEWVEVNRRLDPHAFTMDTVRRRIDAHGDLYADVLHTPQSLARALASLR
jgi:bifunctional non-homologous end joining protein LigD